ncbi:MAG: hypothetical protein AAFV43_07185 [Planctomycetota bacterium]
MPYQLPPDLSSRIDGFVSAGYESPDAVMREALAALEARDADLVAIKRGIDEEASGRFSNAHDVIASRRTTGRS